MLCLIIKESNIKNRAIYSEDKRSRYSLTKIWDRSKRKATFIGINPSDATELIIDRTVMNLTNHLIGLEYGQVEIVNLFSYRSKDQKSLINIEKAEKHNLEHIKQAIKGCNIIIVGWGRTAEKNPKYKVTISKVKEELKNYREIVKCFKDNNEKINCHICIGYNEKWQLVEYKL